MKRKFTKRELDLYEKIIIVIDKIVKHKLLPEQINKFVDTLVKLLDEHPQIGLIQDKYGRNLGMYATVNKKLERIVLKALDNYEASIQQDNNGQNIGMHAVYRLLKKAIIKSLDNKKAAKQKDNNGDSIYSLITLMWGEVTLDKILKSMKPLDISETEEYIDMLCSQD